MFGRLFAESGLSLDRLRALVEVGSAGSIAQAAAGDPVRQSQYSRQIKELEDFFQTRLLERQGKGMRFTASGRELARISRFFLLGLSNFQRGCLAEERTYRIGGCATFLRAFVLPTLGHGRNLRPGITYTVEALPDETVERRLHDLTLDFGIVTNPNLSRPLQSKPLGTWHLQLWAPGELEARAATRLFREKRLPFVLPAETPLPWNSVLAEHKPSLCCDTFLEAHEILIEQSLAVVLPDFLLRREKARRFVQLPISAADKPSGKGKSSPMFSYRLAWNPRLLRLNPQATHRRDFLVDSLAKRFGQRG
jgi:DNA-binding transcriptional LysR family regulator